MTAHSDSRDAMQAAVQAFHDRHDLRGRGGEELSYRVALMVEKPGEISSCVTKGKSKDSLSEELADLQILVMGTDTAAGPDLGRAFWDRMNTLMPRDARMVGGRVRVSGFRNGD